MVTLKHTAQSLAASRSMRFRSAETVLEQLLAILVKKYHVKRVVLVGSLADKSRFGFHSDIDLGVEGLSKKQYFSALGEILMEAGEFDVDIIPIEDALPKMREKLQRGKVLYDKG